jgi:hypothetical protein
MEVWMHEVNEFLLFSGFLAALVGVAELGYRLSRRVHPGDAEVSSQVAATQAAVLGLLALLLGFTFSLAMARFEARKELLRDEANAIGTTYLRSELLPEPMRGRVAGLLRNYLSTRFELHEVSFMPDKLLEVHQRSSVLQSLLWADAVSAARAAPESEMVALFVDSLNETIDMHGMRMAAVRNHVPSWIFVLLFLVAIVALGLTGYASGPKHKQAFVLNSLVALLIGAVTLLIFDLHRPARGFIRVELASMEDLRASMKAQAP